MKKLFALILVLLLCLLFAACGKNADNGNKLILGTSADYAPFEFMYADENGKMQYGGIDVSVAKAIAESMDKELQIENMSFDYLLTSLQKGDFDMVIAAMEADETRMKAVDFSDPYYTDYPAMILVKADKADQFQSLDDFSGLSVGAQTATTKEDIVKNDLPGANLVSLALVTDLINELSYGKVDAVVLDGAVAMQYAKANSDFAVADVSLGEVTTYCVAVAKGDPKGLLPGINEAIAKLTSDGSIDQFTAQAESLSGVWEEVSAEAPAD